MLAQTSGSTNGFARGSTYLEAVASRGVGVASGGVGVGSGAAPAGRAARLGTRCPLALCSPPSHEQAYRRAGEAGRVTNRIDEVALVGEVQLARRVDLDRER